MVFGIFRKPLPSDATPQETEASVLKEARDRCYKAKDAYFKCLEDKPASLGDIEAVPVACKSLRAKFEKNCRKSWVKHFDTLRAKELRYIQQLHSNINRSAASARGQLAGRSEPQQAKGATEPASAPSAASK